MADVCPRDQGGPRAPPRGAAAGARRPAAPPGGAAARHKAFTADLIAAIEELGARRAAAPPEELAAGAWAKLQFDLPALEARELAALLDALRSSLGDPKASWPCFTLTAKALENVTAGARRAGGGPEPAPSDAEAALRAALAAGRGGGGGAEQAAAAGGAAGATAQQLYQQLCGVLLLQYVARVVSLPEQQAWALLADYEPEGDDEQAPPRGGAPGGVGSSSDGDGERGAEPQQAAAAAAAAAAQGAPVEAVLSAALQAGAGGAPSGAPSAVIYELVEAAEQDSDGDAYEALEQPPPAAAQPAAAPLPAARRGGAAAQQAAAAAAAQQQQPREPYSWPALRRKLAALAGHVHYSLLAYEPLWRSGGAAQHLLALLRALGAHGRGEELAPLLHAYVALLVDRLAAAPADLPLLQQLWEALGLLAGGGAPGARVCGRGGALPAEALLAFSVAAAVWAQLPPGGGRGALWRLMHEHLLPLLEACTEQLAYGAAPGGAAARGEGFAHALLLAHVAELLVLGRPAGVDVGAALTQRGVTRNVTALFAQHAADGAAEPLRRALLLAACSSQATAAWVLAVPTVTAQLQHPAFALGGPAEAHGALWELLAARQRQPGGAAAAEAGAGCGQLLALLALDPADTAALQRQVAALQLLADARGAAGRQALWGGPVLAALKALAGAVKALPPPGGAGGEAPRGARRREGAKAADSDADSDDEQPDQAARRGAAPPGRAGPGLAARQAAQLAPAALRLVKGLLTTGGKTD
ncbi:hypothetical protein HT031_003294 [Scenedesmus sp. PABB004]|nr:hypothetical protein HT031_003294 [Scenedesmus sp. PABB004]